MDAINKEWQCLESFIGFNVPMFLKQLLWMAGFDSLLSVKHIKSETISEIEFYIDQNKEKVLSQLHDADNLCVVSEYKKQNEFVFLPGHRAILLL